MSDTVPTPRDHAPSFGFEAKARLVGVVLLIGGCFLVLQPFLAAMLFAAVICVTTWPLFVRLRKLLRGRATAAAALMILLLLGVVILPLTLVAVSFAADAGKGFDAAVSYLEKGLPEPPAWVADLPVVGARAAESWRAMTEDRAKLSELVHALMDPAKAVALALGKVLVEGIFQMWLVALVGFFFYRDGDAIAGMFRAATERLAQRLSGQLLATVHGTVTGVVYGILGTAAAQAALALIGFLIAGVPAALALAVATFFLSLIPVGPPLVWGGAALWLYLGAGSLPWAIFMVLWGALLVSSVDNVLKPLLISRGSNMSLLLVALGVFGGVIAFGFVGIFLGPVLLALAMTMLRFWLERKEAAVKEAAAQPPGP